MSIRVSIRGLALVATVVVAVASVAVAVVHSGALTGPAASPAAAASSPAAPAAPPEPTVFDTGMATPHDDDADLWLSWSLVDTATGRTVGSANRSTERTNAESSIKAWISTDFLRIAGENGQSVRASDLATIDAAIRRSDNEAAERLYRRLGADEVLRDLKTVCGVSVSTARRGYWSYAQITAADATTILDCVLDKAPTYPGGDEVVTDLHTVQADNAFGIPEVLPAGTPVAVKNGWTAHSATGKWNVNCVAAWDHYALAVLTRYPMGRGLDHGAGVCRDVTTSVLARLDG